MKLVYKDIDHVFHLSEGYVNELVIENKKMFFEIVNSLSLQSEGAEGDFVLSINDKPVEFSRYADVTVQFAPFQLNRKSLLTKLNGYLEKRALLPENYPETMKLLTEMEAFVHALAEELPFEITCQKVTIAPLLKAMSPEIDAIGKSPLEQIFAYMETVREFDKDRLFVFVNMRAYFSDEEMNYFTESVVLHDFKVLLLESTSRYRLPNTERSTIDEDLCEF